jgi:hypothetical protein
MLRAWLAAQAFVKYRRAGGTKSSPLPDFYIGAHAETEGLTLVTRDAPRYRTYFPRAKWPNKSTIARRRPSGITKPCMARSPLNAIAIRGVAAGARFVRWNKSVNSSLARATPLLAEVISCKLASATAREVAAALGKSHALQLSPSYLQSVAQAVGAQAVAYRRDAHVPMAAPAVPVTTIATGVDGTTVPLVGEGYKEAMCGTLALYEKEGERLTTE